MLTQTPETATRNVVSVDGLTKRYGSFTSVDSLTFDVALGEVTGLLGPNGAGKTTTMKMLLGLIRPSAGHASILGVDHGTPEYVHAIKRVGALIEAPAIYERLSARQNLELQALALGVPADSNRLDELLKLVDLADRAGDHAGKYSLGMKQRLGIAIALVGRPDLLILDEPANGLDPAGIAEIRSLLRRLPEMGVTVLVSSHQLSEVQQACDRLVILANGKLVTSGTTEEILDSHSTRDFTVMLDAAEATTAVERLTALSLTARLTDPDQLTVSLPDGWTGRDLNRVLADSGIYATQLFHDTVSLESAFLTMTGAPK